MKGEKQLCSSCSCKAPEHGWIPLQLVFLVFSFSRSEDAGVETYHGPGGGDGEGDVLTVTVVYGVSITWPP